MHGSFSSDKRWTNQWVPLLIGFARENDLNSREIESQIDKLLTHANTSELGDVIKAPLNEIRNFQKLDLNRYIASVVLKTLDKVNFFEKPNVVDKLFIMTAISIDRHRLCRFACEMSAYSGF
ncbi:hypothetical protein DJ023_18000 [Pantoea agglomerans]|nr:hypothetical protein [Pantoea agglomerans]